MPLIANYDFSRLNDTELIPKELLERKVEEYLVIIHNSIYRHKIYKSKQKVKIHLCLKLKN